MSINRLLYFDTILEDSVIAKGISVYEALMNDDEITDSVLNDYYDIQRSLLRDEGEADGSGTYWQNRIYRGIADSENPFSLAAENGVLSEQANIFAEGDIIDLRAIINADWAKAAEKIEDGRKCVCSTVCPGKKNSRLEKIAEIMLLRNSGECTAKLAEFYRNECCGAIGRYRAFTWNNGLTGVDDPDPITFDDLIGYERQKDQLIRNTAAFLNGRKANNVLLYGDKGTGKSSSVKALLDHFSDRNLRLLSIQKDKIRDISKIMDTISGRGCHFIILIDDLSFEGNEIEYKQFKSVLEGGVELQPSNILLYVTSNRRNLVKEMWSDRGENGEVNVQDGIQERLSLSDRFGLMITFGSPDKKLFNQIVLSIAKREGVDVDEKLLLEEANKWDMRQTSRSGRSAKQFVTYMAGAAVE